MFAIFGLGRAELVVLGIMALTLFGVPLIIFLVTRPSLIKSPPTLKEELADLRAQIADLRDEVERLKNGSAKNDSSFGITTDGPK